MTIKRTLTIAAAITFGGTVPVHAATLVVSNGILTGATGVTVGGNIFDVDFKDGTCAAVYQTCEYSAFDFKTNEEATSAAQALLDQVFVDGSLGNFDSDPSRTFGCDANSCDTLIPYDRFFSLRAAYAHNGAAAGDVVGSTFYKVSGDLSADRSGNFARFTFVSAVPVVAPPVTAGVPEPTTWAMMMFGFGAMGYTLRRPQKAGARIRFA